MARAHFVYPYIVPKDPRFGWELMYSIRSLYKFFKNPDGFDITIVGEKPQWLNADHEDITFIAMDNSDPVKYPRVQFRSNQKMLAAADLYPDIILMHDDFYFIQDITYDELKVPKYVSDDMFYTNSDEETARLTMHQKMLRFTSLMLKDLGKPYIRNYAAHTPMYFKSDNLKRLQKIFPLVREYEQEAAVVEIAYYNFFAGDQNDEIQANDFRVGYWYDASYGDPKTAKMLNHDEKGFLENPDIMKILNHKMPEKSPVEKW